jgi:fatty acid desaturase
MPTSSASAATSHRIAAHELVTPDQFAHLRERAEWKGMALIAHAWCVILGAMALVAMYPNPLVYILAVMVIGSRQLGLAILMHEGAHRCFSHSERRNMALSQWLCAYPIFADTQAYRR